MLRILVLGAGGPAGVNFIKSIKEAEPLSFIIGTDCNSDHLHFITPYVDFGYLIHRYNHPNYFNDIREIIFKHDIKIVYPQTDLEVNAISSHFSQYLKDLGVAVFLPDAKTVSICQNKEISAMIWNQFPIHNFKNPVSISDVQKAFIDLGTNRIWIRATDGAGGKGSIMADKIDIAYHWIRFWQELLPGLKMMAQPYIVGKNIAWQSVWYEGKLIVSQGRERLEYIYNHLTPSGITGTPIIARTIQDEDVNIEATNAVLKINPMPHGIYSVDMLKRGNKIYITEINPGRFFTTSFFFPYAGMQLDLPYANMPLLSMYIAENRLQEFIETYNIDIIPQYNALPPNLYWVRHIDIPARLLTEEEFTEI